MTRPDLGAQSGACALFQAAYGKIVWKRAQAPLCVAPLLVALVAAPALAVDHDNVDAGRPLDFDDAETIAYREKAFEFGAAVFKPRNGDLGVAGAAEFLNGFARNWQLNVGVAPRINRRFDAGDVSLSVQHNFNRETQRSPAFGARAEVLLPTGRQARGVDGRLRAIASRKFGRYGRLHLNADLGLNGSARRGERSVLPGVILGYSAPLGFPTRFDRTLLAQIGYRTAPLRGDNGLLNIGIGLRQQVTVRSVFDVGIKADIAGSKANRENLRLIAGYSTAF